MENNFHEPVGLASYKDLIAVKTGENGDPFVNLMTNPTVHAERNEGLPDMWDLLPDKLLVRAKVAEILEQANFHLKESKPHWNLEVTYGYRTDEIQTDYFMKALGREAAKEFVPDPEELYNRAHLVSAYPPVAGHPTGGAVDLQLRGPAIDDGDMGGKIFEYDGTMEVFNPNINAIQRDNRMLLRECMMKAGFMPFDGEWWHFMYGDAEWAYLRKQPETLYAPKKLDEALAMIKH